MENKHSGVFMAKKKVYIHVGHPKTATTFLQTVFFDYAIKLEQQGVYYPKLDLKSGQVVVGKSDLNTRCYNSEHRILRVKANGGILFYDLNCKHPGFREDYSELLQQVINYFKESNCNKLLLSDENILTFGLYKLPAFKNSLNTLRKEFDVKIILYLRDVISYCMSMWGYLAQNHGYPFSLIDACNATNIHTQAIIDLVNTTGQDDFIITPFEKKYFKNGKIQDHFLTEILGVDISDFNIQKNINISPNPKQAETMIYFNKYSAEKKKISEVLPWRFSRGCMFLLNFNKDSDATITKKELDILYGKYHQYEVEILKKFFNTENSGDMFSKDYKYWVNKIESAKNTRKLSAFEKLGIRTLVVLGKYFSYLRSLKRYTSVL